MRKFTLSLLVLLVSVFFAFGQGFHAKTTDIIKTAKPVVTAVNPNAAKADMYSIDFEAEVAFTFDFMPWTAVDMDGLNTYGMSGVDWPNSGDPQAFLVFNPDLTDPPLTDDEEIQPHTGEQFGACLAAVPGDGSGNDDWFISDMVSVYDGASFTFWARSYVDDYGLERFNVAVSTTTPDPAEFTVISGSEYIEAPIEWTEYSYDLSAYAGQDIYVAIQCVSFDAYIFMIDDLVIDPGEAGVCENFDALTVGGLVADQLGGYWTTWSDDPGSSEDAPVSDMFAHSAPNSFTINDGGIDLVYELGDAAISTGQWLYSHWMYIPTGLTGYFNVQTDPVAGTDWNLDLFFLGDGTGYFATQSTAEYTFPLDTWFKVEINYDLDAGMGQVYFDGVMIEEFENTLTIGGIDYWGWSDEGDPGAYYDDVCFGPGWVIDVPVCENFDELTVGGLVADQLGGYWTTWSDDPGSSEDAPVSDMYAHSAPNSFTINDGGIDLVYELGDAAISTGKYLYSHWMYVPTGYSGYFNVQTDPVAGTDWNLDLYFEDGGTGYFGTQSTDEFVYAQDTWFFIEINYDLDNGYGEVLFDGILMTRFENTLTIGGIDYWGWDGGGPPGAYYDDVCFGEGYEILPPDCENFDALTVGGLVADQLGGMWTTWSGTPGSSEDAPVSDMFANSAPNSFTINDGGIDLIYQLGTEAITTGQWLYSHYMYIPTGLTGYFNVQTDPVAGTDWNLDLFFLGDGTGYFATQSTEEYTFPLDTWFMVEINYDLDNGYGQVYFDGELIVEFENTLSIGGIDYWGWSDEGDPGAYYDDVCFGTGWIVTGIEDPGIAVSNSNVSIFPNPANDRITIESDNVIDEVLIYNNMGQLVYSGRVDNDQIVVNTSTFVTGMYIVQVRSGQAVEVRKLIIE